MKQAHFAVLAALVLLPAAASAETREEAVAYAFLGLADGATMSRGTVHLDWKESSSAPLTYAGHGAGTTKAYDVTFTISPLGDCDYEVTLAGPPAMVRGGKALYARIDLRRISGITPGDETVAITGDGFCETGPVNPACVGVVETDLFGSVEPAKHAQLFAQLKNDACADNP